MKPSTLSKDTNIKIVAAALVFVMAGLALTSFMLPDEADGDSFVNLSIIADEDGRTMDERVVSFSMRRAYHEILLQNTFETRQMKLYATVTDVTNGGNASHWTVKIFEYDAAATEEHHMGERITQSDTITVGQMDSEKVVLEITCPIEEQGALVGQVATTEFYGIEGDLDTNMTDTLTFTSSIGYNFEVPDLGIIGAESKTLIPGDALDKYFKIRLTNPGAKQNKFYFYDSMSEIDTDRSGSRASVEGWVIQPRQTSSLDLASLASGDLEVGIRAPSDADFGPHTIKLFFGGTGGTSNITIIAYIPEPDLQINTDRIVFGRNPALFQQEVEVTVNVFNAGSFVEEDVDIRILMMDENGGFVKVGDATIEGGIMATEVRSVTVPFTPDISRDVFNEGGDGTYSVQVIVKVDPDGYVFESDTTNNDATRDLTIVRKTESDDSFASSTLLIMGALAAVLCLSAARVRKQKREVE